MKNRKPSEVLNSVETDALISALLYKATPEMRSFVMATCPTAYAKIHGTDREIVKACLSSVAETLSEGAP